MLGNILIIGEQAANPEKDSHQEPFCSDKGCSGWLNDQLDAADVPEEYLFWVNALNNDGTEIDIATLVENLKPKAVIALGNKAKQLCEKNSLSADFVYHPQYWKRFKNKEPYPLIALIKRHLCADRFSKNKR